MFYLSFTVVNFMKDTGQPAGTCATRCALSAGFFKIKMCNTCKDFNKTRAFEALQNRSLFSDKPIEESFSDFVDFSCVLAKKDLFREVGLFDEQFFMYCEDLDFLR